MIAMSGMKELINQIEGSNESDFLPYLVNRLLELCMAATGRGYISDDYTATIEFPMNDLWITSDSYYGRIWMGAEDEEGLEVEDDKTLLKLAEELKKRLLSFDDKSKKIREEIVNEVFDKSLDCVFPKELLE